MSKAERTRQFIIEQTAPIFNKQGYAGTSLSDLTAATGLTKGAIYGNFENKEEVALAAFDYNLSLVQAGNAAGGAARDQLRAVTQFYRAGYARLQQMGGCPILNAAVEVDDAPPTALRQRVQQGLHRWHRRLATLIESGQAMGEFRRDADANRYATLFLALIEGGILLARITGEATALLTALDHIDALIDQELTR